MDSAASPAVGRWAGFAAQPAGSASLDALATVDPTQLTGAELVDAIVAAEKGLSLLAAVQMRLMTAFAEPFMAGDPTKLAARLAKKNCATGDADPGNVQLFLTEAATSLAAAEIAAALRIAPVTGGIRVRTGQRMTTELAPTLHALQTGTLDRGKARVIAEHCEPLSPAHTAAVQDLVLPRAGALSTSELRELTGLAVITVDPDGATDRHDSAAARRELTMTAQPDAMASLTAFLPADAAVKIFQVSDLLATGTAGVAGDNRGISARRVDALVDIADQLLTHGHLDLTHYLGTPLPNHHQPPTRTTSDTTAAGTTGTGTTAGTTGRGFTRQGRRPHLTVTIGLNTLAGHDELPGTLAGYGAIPAGLARSIATSAATITALHTDPTTGAATAAGQLTYRPRQDLRDHAAALLNICQFPSCRQPAWRCDLDHREPFNHTNPDRGGPTTPDNTNPTCRRHHLFKHHTTWKITIDPKQHVTHWTSPTGHNYQKPPRLAAPPRIWTTHPGTTITEKLETITSTATTQLHPPETTPSHVEETLAIILLQHELNHPPTEWDPTTNHWPAISDGQHHSPATDTEPSAPDASATGSHEDDDTPPF